MVLPWSRGKKADAVSRPGRALPWWDSSTIPALALAPGRKQFVFAVALQTSRALPSAPARLIWSLGHRCCSIQLTGRAKGFPASIPCASLGKDWSSWWGSSHQISHCCSGMLSKPQPVHLQLSPVGCYASQQHLKRNKKSKTGFLHSNSFSKAGKSELQKKKM